MPRVECVSAGTINAVVCSRLAYPTVTRNPQTGPREAQEGGSRTVGIDETVTSQPHDAGGAGGRSVGVARPGRGYAAIAAAARRQ